MTYKKHPITLLIPLLFLGGCISGQVAHGDVRLPASRQLKEAIETYGPGQITDPNYKPGIVRHIVLFRYKPEVTVKQKELIKRRFLELKNLCQRNGQPYIAAIETGSQSSGEGVDQGLEQGFLVTFNSEGDRNYYVGQPVVKDERFYDPAHQAFKDFVGPMLHEPINPTGVLVFDYTVEAQSEE